MSYRALVGWIVNRIVDFPSNVQCSKSIFVTFLHFPTPGEGIFYPYNLRWSQISLPGKPGEATYLTFSVIWEPWSGPLGSLKKSSQKLRVKNNTVLTPQNIFIRASQGVPASGEPGRSSKPYVSHYFVPLLDSSRESRRDRREAILGSFGVMFWMLHLSDYPPTP